MGKLLRKFLNTPTRGELRALEAEALRAAIDRAWLEHKARAEAHVCSECYRAGFKSALLWYRENKE